MSVDRRIISVLSRVLGKDLVDVDWNDSLASFGLDSLETMDFLYELEKEFNVARLSDGGLLSVSKPTLRLVRSQILSLLVVPASAE
jgi:aryl carrier-like protein